MGKISRRLFTQNTLSSVLTYSLLEACFSCNVFGDKVSPITTNHRVPHETPRYGSLRRLPFQSVV